MVPDGRLRPRPLELAAGLMLGLDDEADPLPAWDGTTAVQALRASVRVALEHSPCVIAFSGGRDSSAVLALALDVARREGLPLPVAVTMRFPGVPEAEESAWQEAVVRHVGLQDWVVVEVEDELDYVGPFAQRLLREHGVLWPANSHVDLLLLEHARGGCLVDGVDGDSVLSWGRLRLVRTLRGRRRPGRSALRDLRDLAAGPGWRRRRALAQGLRLPWLTAQGQQELLDALADELESEPWTYPGRLAWYHRSRYLGALQWTSSLLAAQHDSAVVRPLLDPAFLVSFGKETGRFGFDGRQAAMHSLFGDLLPGSVLRRVTKASFPNYWGPASRAAAQGWSGRGVDPDRVDPEALRRTWASPRLDHRSATLLQVAWSADR